MTRQNLFSDVWDEEDDEGTRRRIFWRPDDARMGATLHEFAPGGHGMRLHMHFGAEEMFFVLSGRLVFRNQQGEEEFAPGDFLFCPEGRAGLHEFRNPTDEPVRLLEARLHRPGVARYRGELLRYLRRLGRPVEPFPGCPEEFAAGLRGDWRAAAAATADPYAGALELAELSDPDTVLAALATLDGLGAGPAAVLVRRRLRDLGVQRIPRGPTPATRENPAGLTERQLDVLGLLAEGLSNPEIAERLVLSVRTVDHHVSAILAKLGVSSRRDAAARHAP